MACSLTVVLIIVVILIVAKGATQRWEAELWGVQSRLFPWGSIEDILVFVGEMRRNTVFLLLFSLSFYWLRVSGWCWLSSWYDSSQESLPGGCQGAGWSWSCCSGVALFWREGKFSLFRSKWGCGVLREVDWDGAINGCVFLCGGLFGLYISAYNFVASCLVIMFSCIFNAIASACL